MVKTTSVQNKIYSANQAISTRLGTPRRISYISAAELEGPESQRPQNRRVSIISTSSIASSVAGSSVNDYRYSYRMDTAANQNHAEFHYDEKKDDVGGVNETDHNISRRDQDMHQSGANLVVSGAEYDDRYDEKGGIGIDEYGYEYDEKTVPHRDGSASRHNSVQFRKRVSAAGSDLNPIVHSFKGPLGTHPFRSSFPSRLD